MDEPQVETEPAASEPRRRGGPWKLIGAVVAATLIGVWLVPDNATRDGDRQAGETPPSLLDQASQQPADAPQPPAPQAVDAVDDSPGGRARALIAQMRASGDLRLDDVFAAATAAQADGRLADAYLLLFFAAREGHVGAALALGSQADPATRDPANSVFESVDLTQAHKWYALAAQSGDAEAAERLADLRNRVERQAAAGDPLAQRITLLWQ